MSRKPDGFTMDQLDWEPWLPTIADIGLSEEQLAALYEQAPNARASRYFATLALDLPALVARTGLFTNAMRSPSGATNDERELAATVTSRVNGCIYCASVHARLYAQYSKRPETIQHILDDGVDTEVGTERERAIIGFAVRLTEDPAGLESADLSPLREAGLSDLEILDVAQAAAMFAWANRLMLTLGEGVYPE